jgi:hypothetical protein
MSVETVLDPIAYSIRSTYQLCIKDSSTVFNLILTSERAPCRLTGSTAKHSHASGSGQEFDLRWLVVARLGREHDRAAERNKLSHDAREGVVGWRD